MKPRLGPLTLLIPSPRATVAVRTRPASDRHAHGIEPPRAAPWWLAVVVALAAPSAAAQHLPAPAGAADDQILAQEHSPIDGEPLRVSPATVRQIQQELNRLGYHAGHVDGIWGPNSQAAMANWQQAQGLEPTGRINVRSLTALGVVPAPE